MYKLYAILAMLSFGIAPLVYKQGIDRLQDPFLAFILHNLAAGLVVITIAWLQKSWGVVLKTPLSISAWIALGAILTSIIAQGFYYKALQTGEAFNVVMIIALYPMVTFFLDLLIRRELPTLTHGIGLMLVLCGIIMLQN